MARYAFHTLDVFTDRIFGGNPLAVFPNGVGLETEQMQAVARELSLSETVFVLPPMATSTAMALSIASRREHCMSMAISSLATVTRIST